MAALTAHEADLQPGFEEADTSVRGVVCLYGRYGDPAHGDPAPVGDPQPPGPARDPAFLVVHGTHDTLVPVDTARDFVRWLRRTACRPVAYMELPGAQHSFDLVHSVRSEHVIDAIETFAHHVGVGPGPVPPTHPVLAPTTPAGATCIPAIP